MYKRMIYSMAIVLILGAAACAATIHWTGAGGDRLWNNPNNWEGKNVPTAVDEVYIDVPAAVAPKGPIVQDGMDAKILGLACEVAGEPTMTMTGGTLEIADWIWWGDGAACHGTFTMSDGAITVTNEHELGWGGGSGTWIMTGGTVKAGRLVIPTATGAAGQLYLRGGTYHVGSSGLSMTAAGLIDITEGTLVLEGNRTADIQGFINGGRITAYGGKGYFDLDYGDRSPGLTTLTAVPITGKAYKPDPPDGARAVTFQLLQWGAGLNAVRHDVYLGTSPDTLAPMGPQTLPMYWHAPGLTPGTTYYWRIDEVEAGGATVHAGDIWSFTAQALTAYYPDPADGAVDASTTPNLTWLPGQFTAQHHVYFGSNFDAVSQGTADTDKGTRESADANFAPGILETLTTYYWRVDETTADGILRSGPVWSFTTCLPVDDFESYTDEVGQRIFQTWIDGFGYTEPTVVPGNGTGATVGYTEPPFAEQTIVHSGKQSMLMDYNNVNPPFCSEAVRDFTPAQDWTVNDVNGLVLCVRGLATNAAAPLYVAIADASQEVGMAVHPDPAVVTTTKWINWKIPLSVFTDAGVDMARVKKIYVGVGDKTDPKEDGTGRIYIDDIRLVRPVPTK